MRVSVALEASESVTRTVSLRVDEDGDGELDRTVAEKRQQLPTSGTAQVTFRVPAGELPMGDHQYGVVAGEVTRMLGTTTVVRTPASEISGAPDSVSTVAGTLTNVSLTVENVGDYGATRTVMLHLGTDGSGSVASGDPARGRSVTLGSGQTQQLSVPVPSSSLDPGNYTYRLAVAIDIEDDRVTDNVTATGTLTVMEPARFSISTAPASNVTRGTPATVAATVTNTGDIGGTTAVTLRGPNGTMTQRTVTLPGGAATNVSFEVATADRPRGDYGYTVATDDDETRTSVQVREGVLAVSELRGNETLIVGDPMVFAANVTNVGDTPATGAVQLRIDLDDDDRPEYDGISRNVTLAPGNETAVRLDVPYMEDSDPLNQVEDLPTGTYEYGVYTAKDS